MNRLILWRHGQTTWNASGRFQGNEDVELSEVGRAQAAAAADRLASLGVTQIVASDLRRAADTAKSLAAVTGLEITYDVRLRERFYGPWQGLTRAEISERWPVESARWQAGASVVGLGIETIDDLAKRTVAAFGDAAATGEVVVVATHGGCARVGCGAMLGWPGSMTRTLSVLSNCHWTELRCDPVGGWRLKAHNVR